MSKNAIKFLLMLLSRSLSKVLRANEKRSGAARKTFSLDNNSLLCYRNCGRLIKDLLRPLPVTENYYLINSMYWAHSFIS